MGIMSKSNIKINNSLINKHKYSSFSIFLFQFLIFLSLIHNSLSVTFSFPKAITLNNGNIFIIHKLGIDVYTSNLKTLIFNVKEFASSEQISNEQTLAKVIIKTFRDDEDDNNLIFCFIINKIYIFESNGAIFYEEASNSIISNFVGSYYDLSLVEKSGNKYYYIIGFVNSQSQAAFFRFEFDYDIKANTLKNTMSPFRLVKGSEESGIANYGLTCEILNDDSTQSKNISPKNVFDPQEFMKSNNFSQIQITFDGVKHHHNETRYLKTDRKPTYDRILSNVDNLVSTMPDSCQISLRINIDRANANDFQVMWDFFNKQVS